MSKTGELLWGEIWVLQFRLFFVWLTKSLRQLSNDVVPSSNQLPVINRFPLTPLPA